MYEALFRYLLAVEHATRALDEVWHHLTVQLRPSRRRHGSGGRGGTSGAAIAALRHRMAHVLRVLREFLMQDVIERAFAALQSDVAQAKTFLQVRFTRSPRMLLTVLSVCTVAQAGDMNQVSKKSCLCSQGRLICEDHSL